MCDECKWRLAGGIGGRNVTVGADVEHKCFCFGSFFVAVCCCTSQSMNDGNLPEKSDCESVDLRGKRRSEVTLDYCRMN